MPEAEWPLTVRLNPNVAGLDSLITPAPKYDSLNAQNLDSPRAELSRNPAQQELQLINDVFCILSCGEGDFIKFVETFDPGVLDDKLKGPQYKLPVGLDPSLRDVATRLAEISGSAYAVRTFADHFSGIEYGKVNQALSSAFRVLHQLFLSHVALIEGRAVQPPRAKQTGPAKSQSQSSDTAETEDANITLYTVWVHLEPFALHLTKARFLIARFMEETRLARDRKRRHGDLDLVERASTSQFVDHDEKDAVIELRGGAVLRSIAEIMRREMGDSDAANLYEELIAAASKPYLMMLEHWITEGELDDPFDEFLIQETQAYNSSASKENVDDYWDKRYTVRAMVLPLQLSSPETYNMLLISGKYLNVIRDAQKIAGRSPTHPFASGVSEILDIDLKKCRSVEDPRVVEAIVKAYKYANRTLKQTFNDPPVYNLRALLLKLREVFFLFNTDLYDSFLANAEAELQQPVSKVSLRRLEYVLATVKDTEDPWNQHINVTLSTEPLKEALISVVEGSDMSEDDANAKSDVYTDGNVNAESRSKEHKGENSKLTGRDVVQFDFTVPFPLNLVVPRRSVMRYQFLFRHITELKSVHDMLSWSWVLQVKDSRWKIPHSLAEEELAKTAVQCVQRAGYLRQRMLQLITDLIYHSTVDGIQQEYTKFMESIDTYDEVNELVDAHIRFLDRSLMNCLLSDPQLLKSQYRLLSLCRQFAKFLDTNADAVIYMTGSGDIMLDEHGNEIPREDVYVWFDKTLTRYEESFNRNMRKFHTQLENYMPNNFVAGASTLYLIQRLEPLLS